MSGSEGATGALVLAAGKGTRMKSDLPKVLLPILDQPILYYVLRALETCGVHNGGCLRSMAAVVGHKGELVCDYLSAEWPDFLPIWQNKQLGTGHAVQIAKEWWAGLDHLLVLPGDIPLLSGEILSQLVSDHKKGEVDCSFISFRTPNPYGYGRVVRANGNVSIVEEKDATEEQKLLTEVNSGIYIFKVSSLLSHIYKLDNENAQGEYYLPDIISMMVHSGMIVRAVYSLNEDEFRGINTPRQLAEVTALVRLGVVDSHLAAGVRMMDPSSVWIGPKVIIAENVFLDPFVQIWGNSFIGEGSHVGGCSLLRNMTIGRDVEVVGHAVLCDSILRDGAKAGPFIVIRDGASIEEGAQVGKFVEIKKSVLGKGSKAPHLSYLGDAVVGERTNIGAGTITCNYDGVKKNSTAIGDNCFIGSDTMFVAPVKIGDNVFTAAGSVITQDVPDDALAVGRARQKNIDGWVKRKGKNERGHQK